MVTMKHFELIICLLALSFVSAFAFQSLELTDPVIEENVEALTNSRIDPLKACDSYCKTAIDHVCVLKTNYGFPITCVDMRMP